MALALSAGSAARAVAARVVVARGYAASAASGAMMRRAAAAAAAEGTGAGMQGKEGPAAAAAAMARGEVSWVPDPVTGHYRPSNWAGGVDAADLRAAHLARSYARA
ncbi:protein SENESCENCE-ASSOCIATED GENE 21, mitochondrial-like [Oryza brachyantha]|uniref:protein SENESCENCE-ASSOCIATED GENE 21, mitochondrial-like n=1 Tax=Oryza brachyantha TaxID=4533 RepID=UPI001ADAC911|nr:protein SENESCENCE-ASSOCIATED GENE 21, mitochondrial-like [Oryza brachyantha]